MHMHFYCYLTRGTAYLLDRGKEWCHSAYSLLNSHCTKKWTYCCVLEGHGFQKKPALCPQQWHSGDTSSQSRFWVKIWIYSKKTLRWYYRVIAGVQIAMIWVNAIICMTWAGIYSSLKVICSYIEAAPGCQKSSPSYKLKIHVSVITLWDHLNISPPKAWKGLIAGSKKMKNAIWLCHLKVNE